MPVNIKELNINAIVSGDIKNKEEQINSLTQKDRELIILECLDRVKELFRNFENQR